MASNLLNSPITLTAVMGSSYWATRGGTPHPLRISAVRLLGGSTASIATITDPISGNVLCELQAGINTDDSTTYAVPNRWKDFQLTGLTGTGAVVQIQTV